MCSGPMLWDIFGAHVVERVRNPCCETCSGPVLRDVLCVHVLGCLPGPCFGTRSGHMFWDMFWTFMMGSDGFETYVVGRVLDQCCGTW